jgi:hypothetical protein
MKRRFLFLFALLLPAAVLSADDGFRRPDDEDFALVRRSPDAIAAVARNHREAFDLLNRSIDLLGWEEADPVALVRAVNHLHALGKDQALETLRAYVQYATAKADSEENKSPRKTVPDQQRLCYIIPLLFVPVDEKVELPSLSSDTTRRTKKNWEGFDISLHGDLPFHSVAVAFRSGPPDPPRGYLVRWAARNGRLRDKPLRPTDDPLKAADEVCERLLKVEAEGSGYGDVLKNHIRQQAWRTIKPLFPEEARARFSGWLFDDDRNWKPLKDAAAKLKIRWSETKQRYFAE